MSNIHTLTDNLLALVPDHNVTASANGGSVDTQGYQRAMLVITTTTAAASTAAFILQDSADGLSFAAISGVVIPNVGASTSANVQTISVACKNHRRFLRLNYTITGTTSVDADYLLANPDLSPVAQTIAAIVVA